jgi:hypothetical protein
VPRARTPRGEDENVPEPWEGKFEFDRLGLLYEPFSILPGGYVVYSEKGTPDQKDGTEFPPWRRDMKFGRDARTALRKGQGSVAKVG